MKSHLLKIFTISILLSSTIYAKDTITIGTIDTDPKEKIFKFKALADYLETKLQTKTIKFNVEIPSNIQNAIELIQNNKLDIYIDSVYPTLLVKEKTGIVVSAKRWKKEQEGYKSIIFTKKDSNINSIADLKGKSIAFEDEFSTSGYYIPKRCLEEKGLKLSNDDSDSGVKYVFSRSEENSLVWLLFGKVDAATIDDGNFNSIDQNNIKVVYKSELIPRHLVSFSKSLDKKVRDEILSLLYDMEKDPVGMEVLKKFSKTKRFSPLTKDDLKMIQKGCN